MIAGDPDAERINMGGRKKPVPLRDVGASDGVGWVELAHPFTGFLAANYAGGQVLLRPDVISPEVVPLGRIARR